MYVKLFPIFQKLLKLKKKIRILKKLFFLIKKILLIVLVNFKNIVRILTYVNFFRIFQKLLKLKKNFLIWKNFFFNDSGGFRIHLPFSSMNRIFFRKLKETFFKSISHIFKFLFFFLNFPKTRKFFLCFAFFLLFPIVSISISF